MPGLSQEAESSSYRRLHALDAARGIAMLLGICSHGILAYAVPSSDLWPVVDTSRFAAAPLIFYSVFLFRMPAFFIISGFFSRMLLEKRGRKAFIENRFKRIVVPFVVATLTARYAVYRLQAAAMGISGGSFVQNVSPDYLWFLYYLTGMLALAVIVRSLIRPTDNFLAAFDRILGRVFGSPGASLVLAVVTTLLFRIAKGNILVIGYTPNLAILAYFGFFFAVGWWVQRQPPLILVLRKNVRWLAAFGLVCLALFLIQSSSQSLAIDYVRSLATWSMALAFIGVMLAVFDRTSKTMGFLADASYWTYLTHLPLVLALQLALKAYAFSGWLKFGIVVTVTAAVCLISFELIVRDRWLGRWLVGRRRPRYEAASMATA